MFPRLNGNGNYRVALHDLWFVCVGGVTVSIYIFRCRVTIFRWVVVSSVSMCVSVCFKSKIKSKQVIS